GGASGQRPDILFLFPFPYAGGA
ncbi:MAG: hypothetical protein B193_2735, partial [Solidesulfovibrio magneticus str. Maddingley MBC34]